MLKTFPYFLLNVAKFSTKERENKYVKCLLRQCVMKHFEPQLCQ